MSEATTGQEQVTETGAWDAYLTQLMTQRAESQETDGLPVGIRLMTLATLVTAFDDAELQSFTVEIGRQHAIMPIIDPTKYRNVMGQLQTLEMLAREVQSFRHKIMKAAGRE